MFKSIDKWVSLVEVLFLTPVLLMCSGCFIQGDYEVKLPNGYLLARSNSYDIAIFGPSGRVVPPLIVAIGVHEDIVFGKVEESHNPWLLENDERAKAEKAEQERGRGYFLLNTKSHALRLGLTREAWLIALRDSGLQSAPQLTKPGRSFKY